MYRAAVAVEVGRPPSNEIPWRILRRCRQNQTLTEKRIAFIRDFCVPWTGSNVTSSHGSSRFGISPKWRTHRQGPLPERRCFLLPWQTLDVTHRSSPPPQQPLRLTQQVESRSADKLPVVTFLCRRWDSPWLPHTLSMFAKARRKESEKSEKRAVLCRSQVRSFLPLPF